MGELTVGTQYVCVKGDNINRPTIHWGGVGGEHVLAQNHFSLGPSHISYCPLAPVVLLGPKISAHG